MKSILMNYIFITSCNVMAVKSYSHKNRERTVVKNNLMTLDRIDSNTSLITSNTGNLDSIRQSNSFLSCTYSLRLKQMHDNTVTAQ